jgi:hypothetical protein
MGRQDCWRWGDWHRSRTASIIECVCTLGLWGKIHPGRIWKWGRGAGVGQGNRRNFEFLAFLKLQARREVGLSFKISFSNIARRLFGFERHQTVSIIECRSTAQLLVLTPINEDSEYRGWSSTD